MKFSAENIREGKITINNGDKGQDNLLLEISDFDKSTKPKKAYQKK